MPYPLGGRNAALIEAELIAGKNDLAISLATGAHRSTVRKYRRILEAGRGKPFLCRCGLPGNHRTWCEYRLAETPRRRLLLRRWHSANRLSDIRCRYQTYRRGDDARRSFYKWVCKQEFYGPLFIIRRGNWIYHVRGAAKYTYGVSWNRGYPAWEASNSAAKTRWENEFLEQRDAILAKARERATAATAAVTIAQQRIELAIRTTRFFQLFSAGPALVKI